MINHKNEEAIEKLNIFINEFTSTFNNLKLLTRDNGVFEKINIEKKILREDFLKNSTDNNKFDLILGDLPFGLNNIEECKDDKMVRNFSELCVWKNRLKDNLSDNGYGIILAIESVGATKYIKDYLESDFENENIFLNGLIELPKKTSLDTGMNLNLAIFSKSKTEKIFLGSLKDNDTINKLVKNFLNGIDKGNLYEGKKVSIKEYKGFKSYYLTEKIEKLETTYKEYKQIKISELADIKLTRTNFIDVEKTLFISNIGKLDDIETDIENLKKKHQNYFQLIVDDKKVDLNYLKYFLLTDLGQLSLNSISSGKHIEKINKSELSELEIPIPDLEIQKQIVESHLILEQLEKDISIIKKDLSLNPNAAKSISEKLGNAVEVLGGLSKEDEILKLIRNGEDLKTEFKSSFSKPMEEKKEASPKIIEHSALKNIAAFLNKDGGNLIIGVRDDGEILGIENDNYKDDDSYLLHVKNKIRDTIGAELSDFWNIEIINVRDKKVLIVRCAVSDKPVYLGKEEEFYIRVNPAAEILTGSKMVEYIKIHFNNK